MAGNGYPIQVEDEMIEVERATRGVMTARGVTADETRAAIDSVLCNSAMWKSRDIVVSFTRDAVIATRDALVMVDFYEN